MADPVSSLLQTLTSPYFLELAVFPGLLSIAVLGALLTWLERKVTARVQLRIGPYFASPAQGILQAFADIIKLIFKEVNIPKGADRFFFVMAPVTSLILGAALLGLIPFTPEIQIANLQVGLPAFLAIVTLSPTLVLLAGWSANSKFPFIGGLRALFQQTAYEIPLWLSAVGVVMLAGTLNLTNIVSAQNTGWFILPQLLGALVFLVTSTAEMEKLPFDLPEAESEIMMGWQAEYPGALFMLVQGPSFVKLYAFSALFATIYLGGYLGPAPIPPIVWFFLKTLIIIVLIMLFRSTFPRVRLDQLLKQGWTTLLGLSVINIAITFFLVVGIPRV
ncbi:MAG TPA: NADH-quinone oxidoreductase subunit NuoH [Candidatus Bathyarchaeia archaeon]|nr:NADH-quinone oxidoreductase subunit NuoH [Candidatus Bathyarchaeia archaeon]